MKYVATVGKNVFYVYTSINVGMAGDRRYGWRIDRARFLLQYSIYKGSHLTIATQKIFRIRREYNAWVADESIEDYALRYTPRSFRKWSEWRVGNTAFGAVSFLALEAIGAAIALNYGFTNALWAFWWSG